MKIDRLMGILTILMQKEKVTAPELAQRFEVSRRTIIRDIDDLCKAGIPIVTAQGAGGGISIIDGYKIDSSIFTKDELGKILTGLKGLDTVSPKASEDIYNKLNISDKALITENNFITIDLGSFYKDSVSKKLELIKEAIKQKRILEFDYYYAKGHAVKAVEPYLAIYKWSHWYLYGYCISNQDFRMYKMNRLWNINITENPYTPREIDMDSLDFDSHFKAKGTELEAVFEPKMKYRLIEEYGPNCFKELEDGKLYFHREFINNENLVQWVLGFGYEITVLQPDWLINQLREIGLKIYEKYQ